MTQGGRVVRDGLWLPGYRRMGQASLVRLQLGVNADRLREVLLSRAQWSEVPP